MKAHRLEDSGPWNEIKKKCQLRMLFYRIEVNADKVTPPYRYLHEWSKHYRAKLKILSKSVIIEISLSILNPVQEHVKPEAEHVSVYFRIPFLHFH